MTTETHNTPNQTHPDRGPFGDAYDAYAKVVVACGTASLRLITNAYDTYLHSIASAHPPDRAPSIPGVVCQASDDLQQAIDVAKQNPETSLTDLFRAKTILAHGEERVVAKLAYSKPGNYRERRELASYAYGLNHHLIVKSLEMMDELVASPDYDDVRAGVLRGIINEQTALALLNRTANGERIALPSDTLDDLKNNTDIVYTRYVPKKRQAYSFNIQVKSSASKVDETDIPEHGFVVTAFDIGNSQSDYRTARLIAKELAGGEGLTHAETNELNRINSEFMNNINEKIHAIPGVPVTAAY